MQLTTGYHAHVRSSCPVHQRGHVDMRYVRRGARANENGLCWPAACRVHTLLSKRGIASKRCGRDALPSDHHARAPKRWTMPRPPSVLAGGRWIAPHQPPTPRQLHMRPAAARRITNHRTQTEARKVIHCAQATGELHHPQVDAGTSGCIDPFGSMPTLSPIHLAPRRLLIDDLHTTCWVLQAAQSLTSKAGSRSRSRRSRCVTTRES